MGTIIVLYILIFEFLERGREYAVEITYTHFMVQDIL
jgi:hypothetical protein